MMKSSKDRNTVQNLKRSYHKLGHRFTNQRASIWRLFSNAPRGYTIQDAAGVLKKKGIGHATVYRTVNTLQKLGRLHWVHEKKRRASICCPACNPFPYAGLPLLRPGGGI
jgi:Fe2+ or Zn2+ uptake regulation protein